MLLRELLSVHWMPFKYWVEMATLMIVMFRLFIVLDPTGRILRDAKLYEIGAGTSEVRRLIIGRNLGKAFPE
jgi:alkylation response protein AidB-like acyl-CoA dehydrogenase